MSDRALTFGDPVDVPELSHVEDSLRNDLRRLRKWAERYAIGSCGDANLADAIMGAVERSEQYMYHIVDSAPDRWTAVRNLNGYVANLHEISKRNGGGETFEWGSFNGD